MIPNKINPIFRYSPIYRKPSSKTPVRLNEYISQRHNELSKKLLKKDMNSEPIVNSNKKFKPRYCKKSMHSTKLTIIHIYSINKTKNFMLQNKNNYIDRTVRQFNSKVKGNWFNTELKNGKGNLI